MGEDLIWLQAFGPAVGMAALLFIMQARGHLVPKRLHDQVRLDRDTYKQAAETALAAATRSGHAVDTLVGTVAVLVRNSEEQLELTRQILGRLPAPAPTDRSAA